MGLFGGSIFKETETLIIFFIYINDICETVLSEFFADDTTLFVFVDNPVQSATVLNNDPWKFKYVGPAMVSTVQSI